MDVLGSAIAIVQVADRIIGICKSYVEGVRDAPADLRLILIELGSLKCVLEVLELSASSTGLNFGGNSDDSNAHSSATASQDGGIQLRSLLQKFGGRSGPLEGCRGALKALETLFPKDSECSVAGGQKRLRLSYTNLAWPFKKDKASRLLEEIGRHKATISLGLTADATQDLKHIRSRVEYLCDTTSDAELNQVLQWLVTIDPSPNHNAACGLHEPHTGQWLTNSPEYSSWKDRVTRFIWLHGIPGAGKTVLLSYIFEDVKRFCKQDGNSAIGWAYYYCYFGRNHDETPHLLRWAINQLCRQIGGIPSEIRDLFREGGSPSTAQLITAFTAVIQNFSHIYLVVDALDESMERDRILDLLLHIVSDKDLQRIQLLVMSRKEVDIERALTNFSTNISLSNPYVDKDIQTYINSYLDKDRKFQRWHEELRLEIEKALVKGAKGMFRWVFCQLDILKRLNGACEIRNALSQLPKTLDETYERILCSIPPENQTRAHKALQLLAYSGRIHTIIELNSALSVDFDRLTFDEDEYFEDESILEICSCLVTVGPVCDIFREIRLAHYTVEEFISSARIFSGSAASFYSTRDSASFLDAQYYIVSVLENDRIARHPFPGYDYYNYAGYMIELVQNITSPADKAAIASKFWAVFDPLRFHFDRWLNFLAERFEERQLDSLGHCFPVWMVENGAERCITFGYLCLFGYYDAAEYLITHHKDLVSFNTVLKPKYNRYQQNILGNDDEDFLDEEDIETNGVIWDQITLRILHQSAEWGHENLSLLHIATLCGKEFFELCVRAGATLKNSSGRCPSLLLAAVGRQLLLFDHKRRRSLADSLYLVDILNTHKVQNQPAESMTALQLVIWEAMDFREPSEMGENLKDAYQICKRLMNNDIDVNEVGDDSANMARVALSCATFFPELENKNEDDNKDENEDKILRIMAQKQEMTDAAQQTRGTSWRYDTPLRILENRGAELENIGWTKYGLRCFHEKEVLEIRNSIKELKHLILSHGAVSLHLFPVAGLPGYVEEDIEAWHRMK